VNLFETMPQRVRAWKNIATSATMRRVRPDWVPMPHAGHIIVTYRCNLKCECCPSWKQKNHNDLSTEEWMNTFSQLKSLDIVKVLGGEPLIRRDIVTLMTGVRDIIDPFVLQLTTNGMLTERTLEMVHAVAWPGLQLRISVDGIEETHDRMRGVEGSWKKVTQTVREVAALKDRYGFKLGINFAITDSSIPELDAMIDFADSVGADLIPGVNVDPFLIGGTPPEEGGHQRVVMVSDIDAALGALRDDRVGLRKQLPGIDKLLSRFLVRDTFRRQLEGEQYRFTCRELRDLIYLLPDGNLVRCGLDHKSLGNVRDSSIEELWRSPAVVSCRDTVDACPGCYQASVQIMSRLYAGCILDS
jgi:MoaA/NifB/PqqE/SkfB family radical SAM enzyme